MSIDPRQIRALGAWPGAVRALRRAVWLPPVALLAVWLPACAGAHVDSTAPATAQSEATILADEAACATPDLPDGAPTLLAEVVVPTLDEQSLAAWVAYMTPSSDEMSWAVVDWLPSYAEGVVAAQEQRRPLLLWAMNGHPLGCT